MCALSLRQHALESSEVLVFASDLGEDLGDVLVFVFSEETHVQAVVQLDLVSGLAFGVTIFGTTAEKVAVALDWFGLLAFHAHQGDLLENLKLSRERCV